jgi:DNA polymerase-3 subunit epsilon
MRNETVVFTGTLSSMTRKQAQQAVLSLNGTYQNKVTAKTTIVVVGAIQHDLLNSSDKTNKIKAVERFNQLGASIQIINEKQFIGMLLQHMQRLWTNL